MQDDEIVENLRSKKTQLTPIELANFLDQLTSGGLSQGTMATYFKRAFPAIPLRVLLEAGGWSRLSGGSLSDKAFNELIQPWLLVESSSNSDEH